MIEPELVGSEGWKRGIRGYADRVLECRNCQRPTNVIWLSVYGLKVLACSIECANKWVEKRQGE